MPDEYNVCLFSSLQHGNGFKHLKRLGSKSKSGESIRPFANKMVFIYWDPHNGTAAETFDITYGAGI